MEIARVMPSAIGTESQMPTLPMSCGRMRMLADKIRKVRRKEIMADVFPSENEVNIAEAKILKPVNRNETEKRYQPLLAIWKTSLPRAANMDNSEFLKITLSKYQAMELTITKPRLIRNSFFKAAGSSRP